MQPDAFLEAAYAVALLIGQPLTARHHIVAAILAAGGTATRRRIIATVPASLTKNTTICAVDRMRREGTLVDVAHGRYRLAGLDSAFGPNGATFEGGSVRGACSEISLAAG